MPPPLVRVLAVLVGFAFGWRCGFFRVMIQTGMRMAIAGRHVLAVLLG